MIRLKKLRFAHFAPLSFCIVQPLMKKRGQDLKAAGAIPMDIFCPTCREGYRIPSMRVPKTSRMVMCNSCGTAWKQFFGAEPNFMAPTLDQPVEKQREVRRPIYSKAVLQVLREEAALEAKLRA